MTTNAGSSGAASMRFSLDEVLSGMLASIESDSFTDDTTRLASMFEGLAGEFTLFAPLASGVDPQAVGQALQTLAGKKFIEHRDGHFFLTESGRSYCVSSKRTLFNRRDSEQLEAAAKVFNTL